MNIDGDKARTVLAMVISRMWSDAALKKKFFADPKAVLKDEGLDVAADITLKVVENTADASYISLTPDVDIEKNSAGVVALFNGLLPIPVGHEVRLVQSTADTRYVVVPAVPAGVDLKKLSSTELMKLAHPTVMDSTNVKTQSQATVTTVGTVTATGDVGVTTVGTAVAAVVLT